MQLFRTKRAQRGWPGGLLCGVVVVAALTLGQTNPAFAFPTITASLASVSGASATGTATVSGVDDAATVTVDLTGLAPGTTYRVLLQAGTCATPSASSGLLGTIQADSSGQGKLTSTTARAGAVGTPTPLTLSLLGDGDHVISVAGPTTVACGSIPRAVRALPTTGEPAPIWPAIGLGVLTLAAGIVLRRRQSP